MEAECSRLPDEVIWHLFEYLGHADRGAASQVCRDWYEASAQDRNFLLRIALVISKNEHEAVHTLGCSSRQYKRLVLKELDIDFSGRTGETLLDDWSVISSNLEHIGIHNCIMREKTFAELLACCHSLKNLSIGGCNELFMSGRLLLDTANESLKGLRSITHLSITSNRYLSDALLMRITGFMPRLQHLCLSDDQIQFHPGIQKKFYPVGQELKYSESVLTVGIVIRVVELNVETLTSLDLSRTLIDNVSLINICKVANLKLRNLAVSFCDQLSKPGFEAIAEFQKTIVELNVSSCSRFTDQMVILICNSLTKLKNFNFSRCRAITDAGFQAIKCLTEIKSLNISRSTSGQLISSGLVEALTDPLKVKLRYLNLSALVIEPRSLETLLGRLDTLEHLDLTACCVTDDCLKLIFNKMVGLRVLKLAYCDAITDRGLTGISSIIEDIKDQAKENVLTNDKQFRIPLGSRFEAAIREDASRKQIVMKQLEDRSFEACDSASNLKGLRELDLCGCRRISDLSLMFSIKFLDLKILDIGYCNQITDRGLASIISPSERWNLAIEELCLRECNSITDAGLAALLPNLRRLRVLILKGCSLLTDKTVETLGSCKALRYLDVSSCHKMSLEKAEELLRNLPGLDTCMTSGLRTGGLPGVQSIRE